MKFSVGVSVEHVKFGYWVYTTNAILRKSSIHHSLFISYRLFISRVQTTILLKQKEKTPPTIQSHLNVSLSKSLLWISSNGNPNCLSNPSL